MSEYLIQSETLEDIADAIRAKTGGSALINPEDMPSEIASIETGGGLPEGMTHIASGTITFASRTVLTTPVDLGTDFTPKFVLLWTDETIGNGNLLFGGGARYLTASSGSFRYGYCQGSTLEGIQSYSSDPDHYIDGSSLIMYHGARFYAATTYNWFAFA